MPMIDRGTFQINYEITCSGGDEVLLLVAGLGEQIGSVEYPKEQCQIFAEQGFTVVRMDNRGMGLSGPVASGGNSVSFSLLDVADDVIAVIDDLGRGPVNLVGASMGGFIVRWATIRAPDSVKTLTVVMSGSGASAEEDGPQPHPDAQPSLMGMFQPRERGDEIDWSTDNWRWLWGNGYPFPEAWVRERIAASIDRSYRPGAVASLLNASRSTVGLWHEQRNIRCPTLVMHGAEDPVFPAEHGQAISRQIPGASLWLDPKMGHIMHREQWHEMAERIAALTEETSAQ